MGDDGRDLVTYLAEQAERLRKAGVLRVTVGPVVMEFAPWVEPVTETDDDTPRPDPPNDIYQDPDLYQGRQIPGIPRPDDA